MANFVATLLKLTSLATLFKLTSLTDYSFQEIHIKLTFVLITYTRAVFTADDILNTLVLSQTTDVNEIARRNFLGFQALAVLNFILSNNLLIQSQPNAKAL